MIRLQNELDSSAFFVDELQEEKDFLEKEKMELQSENSVLDSTIDALRAKQVQLENAMDKADQAIICLVEQVIPQSVTNVLLEREWCSRAKIQRVSKLEVVSLD